MPTFKCKITTNSFRKFFIDEMKALGFEFNVVDRRPDLPDNVLKAAYKEVVDDLENAKIELCKKYSEVSPKVPNASFHELKIKLFDKLLIVFEVSSGNPYITEIRVDDDWYMECSTTLNKQLIIKTVDRMFKIKDKYYAFIQEAEKELLKRKMACDMGNKSIELLADNILKDTDYEYYLETKKTSARLFIRITKSKVFALTISHKKFAQDMQRLLPLIEEMRKLIEDEKISMTIQNKSVFGYGWKKKGKPIS